MYDIINKNSAKEKIYLLLKKLKINKKIHNLFNFNIIVVSKENLNHYFVYFLVNIYFYIYLQL